MQRYIRVLAMAICIMQPTIPLLAKHYETEEALEKAMKRNKRLACVILGEVALGVIIFFSHYLFGGSSEGKIERYKQWIQANDQDPYISDKFSDGFLNLVDKKIREKNYTENNWRKWVDKKDEHVLVDFAQFFEESQINITKIFHYVKISFFLTVHACKYGSMLYGAFALNHLFHLLDKIAPGEKRKTIEYDKNIIVKSILHFHKNNSKAFVDQKIQNEDGSFYNKNVNAMPCVQVLLSHGFDPTTKVMLKNKVILNKNYIAYAQELEAKLDIKQDFVTHFSPSKYSSGTSFVSKQQRLSDSVSIGLHS
ncbi:MAG: hypothetical protein AAF335_01045, partial [Bacteroidota bacterium]